MQTDYGIRARVRLRAGPVVELSRVARTRRTWMDFYRSHRPHRRRQPSWTPELDDQVLALRRQYLCWGKDKLAVLLARAERPVSVSMVGQPGDLVQLDTLDLRPRPGVVLKHFTARDVIPRWDVVEAHRRATSLTAAGFLDTLLARMPFPVRALQVDGGSEVAAAFEQACRERGLRLFVLPPRSPKLNGSVERAQPTHTEEFYEVTPCAWQIESLNRELRDCERTYNTVRPHQALGYLTPQEFLRPRQGQGELDERTVHFPSR